MPKTNEKNEQNNNNAPQNKRKIINNERIGKIHDFKSPNLIEQINKNVTINKNQSTSMNDNMQNEEKKNTEIKTSNLSLNFEQEMKQGETKEILRHIPKTNVQNGTNNSNDLMKTIKVLEAIKQPQIVLDDTRRKHIEFLLGYICFEDRVNTKLKNPYIARENCFIINYSIIDYFKNFYQSKKLFGFFTSDINLKKIYNKYLNQYKYIGSHEEDMFINEAIQNLPKDYIKEIQEKDISQFLPNLQNINL